jgi:hypothetical protein
MSDPGGVIRIANLKPIEHEPAFYGSDMPLKLKLNGSVLQEIGDVMVFPGLINSHDHLEFNLFPLLCNKIYCDYKEWGGDIHLNNKSEIDAVLDIPVHLRIGWGILKNLLCGVTQVVHHGGHHQHIKTFNYPVELNYQYLHAPATDPLWKFKMLYPSTKPVMVHVGEGVGIGMEKEIDELVRANWLRKKLIGVHGVAMTEAQSEKFNAMVWCPYSNIKLYGKAADVRVLKKNTSILFGTDSALSASSDLWEHLRLAQSLGGLTQKEIYQSITATPMKIFKRMQRNSLVVARRKGGSNWESFFSLQPEDILMVLIDGRVMLADDCLKISAPDLTRLKVGNSVKHVVKVLGSVVEKLENSEATLPLNVRSK